MEKNTAEVFKGTWEAWAGWCSGGTEQRISSRCIFLRRAREFELSVDREGKSICD